MAAKSTPKQESAKQSTDDSRIVSAVLDDFREAYTQKVAKERLFREIYQRYRSYLDVYNETTRSTIFIPESFKVIETVSPRMTADPPGWNVLPRDSDQISNADHAGALLAYRYDQGNIHRRVKTVVKQGLIYGTSFAKVGWDNDKKAPTMFPIDIADIYGDPKTFDWETGFIIHRFYKTLFELKDSGIKYENLDQVEYLEQHWDKASVEEFETTTRDDLMRQSRFSVQGLPYDPKRDGHEIMEWWNFVEGKMTVRTLADRKVLIRNEGSPLPLNEHCVLSFIDQEVPFEKWGIGEIEPILDLQDELNTTRNQRIDEKNLSIHNMWIIDKNAGINYKNLTSRPGGMILADDINGIKALDKQNITADSINEINLIQEDIKETTGVTNAILGMQGNARQAASTTAIVMQQATERFKEKMNNRDFFLKNLGRWFLALDAEFLPKPIEVTIMGKFGPDTVTIKKSDIPKEYGIEIEAANETSASPELRNQQLRELLQTIAPYLMAPQGVPPSLQTLLREVIQGYDLQNTDDIIQGTAHPLVNKAMANLSTDEMQGVNPQEVQQAITQQLTASGQIGQQPMQPQPGQPQPQQPGAQPQQGQAVPMRSGLPPTSLF